MLARDCPTRSNVSAPTKLPDIQLGTLTLCQFYEIGDEIDLRLVPHCLAAPTARLQISIQARQAESIQIAHPPLRVEMGEVSLTLDGISLAGELHISIYDLGVVTLSIELGLPQPTDWTTIANLLGAVQECPDELQSLFLTALADIERVLHPAIAKPHRASIAEDYSILVIKHLNGKINPADLAEHPLVWAALLGEQRPLSPGAGQLLTSMSYYQDDLALLSWNGALLIESDPLAVATAMALFEFANIELLLMRSYDSALDDELPRMYQQIPRQPRRFSLPLVHRYSRLLYDVQRLLAEFTEVTERVDNALKVTDDVYWNRLYSAMLNVLRVDVWRKGVAHKLALLRETYSLLHNSADAERASALEWTIVVLILFEILMALLGYSN
jgi:hypothetical protein